jgi:hypothetical protein
VVVVFFVVVASYRQNVHAYRDDRRRLHRRRCRQHRLGC